jgi:hypothetical protein
MPFPEVRMGGWTIRLGRPHEASTNLERQIMVAPDEDTPEGQFFRDHETAHAVFTPKAGIAELGEKHEIDPIILDTAENMRLNYMMSVKEMDSIQTAHPLTETPLGEMMQQELSHLKQMGALDPSYGEEAQRKAFLAACSSTYTQDIDYAVGLLETHVEDREILDFLFQSIRSAHYVLDRGRIRSKARHGAVIPFRYTVEVAKILSDALRMMNRVVKPAGKRPPGYEDGGSKLWGNMTIQKVAMQTPSKWRHRFSRIRRSDSGVKITALPRILSDQKIFSYKIRKKGGTVLIDCSGSMSLSSEEIFQIVVAAPAACVALYSGDGKKGVLRIVAEDGKLAAENHITAPGGGGNTIDGPALRWLATKDMPRVWVSDGQVTGIGDAFDGMLHAEAQMLKRMYQVKQVPSGADAVQVFTKGGI